MSGNSVNDVKVISLGGGGVGKSAFGNAFLQKNAFIESDDPDSCTLQTNSNSNIVKGIRRYYIDTQGLKSADGLDESHIKQMVEFLKNWNLGINAFFIVINFQCPRFDQGIQKMMKMLNDFFNNPNIWNQTGIVFTKCYSGYYKREPYESQYRAKVVDFIKTLDKCSMINPSMPCFFVDSCNYTTDESTKLEIERAFQFAQNCNLITSNNYVPVKPQYKEVKEEIISGVIVGHETGHQNGVKVLYVRKENQKRIKYTHWDGGVTYSQPEVLYRYTVTEYPDNSKKVVLINNSSSNMIIYGDIIV